MHQLNHLKGLQACEELKGSKMMRSVVGKLSLDYDVVLDLLEAVDGDGGEADIL